MARDREILDRDKWRCTEQVWDFLRPETPWRRCPVMGSEMVVVEGHTYCPHHARELRGEVPRR